MEAAPRLPMISFELKTSTEPVSFGSKLKQYIGSFYHEDPESYNGEIQQLEQLRGAAVRPSIDINGVQLLKKYYCQLRFLKSRFPMEKGALCAVQFSWKDSYAGVVCTAQDIDIELMSVLYNIGALHTQLGAGDSRQNADGMKMACTHFQCAAWAFQQTRELYPQHVVISLAPEILHFMEIVCLAQAQECILEKSMSDSRKCTIIAKVAAQAVDYYQQAAVSLTGNPNADLSSSSDISDIIGGKMVKDWCRYLRFKQVYHGCISLLYQGQQSEEQQKMGERCALYQAAAERLEEARKIASSNRLGSVVHGVTASANSEIEEALAFTQDVVEGKRKAARNENEFIYHETVPEKDALPTLQGASLVRPVPFGVSDPDVSGPDIFGRLVPMEAHEASSVYSERKAELLRQTGAAIEQRDRELDEFMGSLHHLDCLIDRLSRPQTVPQDVVDRAAALNARPQAVQLLVDAMGKLSAVHHDVDSLLNEAQTLIEKEKEAIAASSDGGKPVLSMPLTDLSREAAKYREALTKANESNEALHRAMTAHVANLRVLGQPLAAVDRHIPRVTLPDAPTDGPVLAELRRLLAKVDEMRQQRAQLVAALREATQADDITGRLVIAGKDRPAAELDKLFDAELAKHQPQVALIEQNLAAQQNILVALTDVYAKLSNARKQVTESFRRRDQIVSALVASYDAYDDLLAKANKGIDFYQKLETNVTKLLQRLRSTCRVQEEEREQKSAGVAALNQSLPQAPRAIERSTPGPKLRDYLQQPGVRPAPLGSEQTDLTKSMDQQPNSVYPGVYLPNANYQQNIPYPQPSLGGSAGVYSSVSPQYAISNGVYNAKDGYPMGTYPTASGVPYSTPNTVYSTPNSTMYQQPHSYQTTRMPQQNMTYHQPPSSYGATPAVTTAPVASSAYQSPAVSYPYSISQPTTVTPTIYGTNIPSNTYATPQSTANTTNMYQQPNIPNAGYITSHASPIQSPKPSHQQPYASPASTTQSKPEIYNHPNVANSTYSAPTNTMPGIEPYQNYPASNAHVSRPQNFSYSQATQDSTRSPQYGTQTPTSNYASPSLAYPYGNTGYQNQEQTDQGPIKSHAQTGKAAETPTVQYTSQYPATQYTGQYPQGQYQGNVIQSHTKGDPQYPQGSKTGQQYPNSGQSQQNTPIPGQYPGGTQPVGVQGQYTPSQGQFSGNGIPTQYPNVAPGQYLNTAQKYPNVQGQYPAPAASGQYPTSVGQYSTSMQNQYPNAVAQYPTSVVQGQQRQYPSGSTVPVSPNLPQQYSQPANVQQYPTANIQGAQQAPVNQYQNYGAASPAYQHTTNTKAAPASNIDLLAGLDFNISQVPLNPVKTEDLEKKVEEIKLENKEEKKVVQEKVEIPKPQVIIMQNEEEVKQKFLEDVETLDKWVSLGPSDSEIEMRWRELMNKERDSTHLSISVARCYPARNRCPDSLPYDHNRVELPCPPASDDYINASRIPALINGFPPLIITQVPFPTTSTDFWNMVICTNSNIVVCLMVDNELLEAGFPAGYWCREYGAQVKSTDTKKYWTERCIVLGETNKEITHIQFNSIWPNLGTETAHLESALVELAQDLSGRSTTGIIIHCLTGCGRSGVLTALLAGAIEMYRPNYPVLIDVQKLTMDLMGHRRNPLRDRVHLAITYRALLHMARRLLPAPKPQPVEEKVDTPMPEPPKDPLSELDPLWKLKVS